MYIIHTKSTVNHSKSETKLEPGEKTSFQIVYLKHNNNHKDRHNLPYICTPYLIKISFFIHWI